MNERHFLVLEAQQFFGELEALKCQMIALFNAYDVDFEKIKNKVTKCKGCHSFQIFISGDEGEQICPECFCSHGRIVTSFPEGGRRKGGKGLDSKISYASKTLDNIEGFNPKNFGIDWVHFITFVRQIEKIDVKTVLFLSIIEKEWFGLIPKGLMEKKNPKMGVMVKWKNVLHQLRGKKTLKLGEKEFVNPFP